MKKTKYTPTDRYNQTKDIINRQIIKFYRKLS